jgi:hypothetical protein
MSTVNRINQPSPKPSNAKRSFDLSKSEHCPEMPGKKKHFDVQDFCMLSSQA